MQLGNSEGLILLMVEGKAISVEDATPLAKLPQMKHVKLHIFFIFILIDNEDTRH